MTVRRSRDTIDGAQRRLGFAVAVALFGLLTMHGWGVHAGDHGSASMPGLAAPAMGNPDVALHAEPHGGVVVVDDQMSGSEEAPHGGKGAGSSLGLVSLCLAVVALASMVVCLIFLARRRLGGRELSRVRGPQVVSLIRDHGPPISLRLCVIRC